jgi:hypothetical protein
MDPVYPAYGIGIREEIVGAINKSGKWGTGKDSLNLNLSQITEVPACMSAYTLTHADLILPTDLLPAPGRHLWFQNQRCHHLSPAI